MKKKIIFCYLFLIVNSFAFTQISGSNDPTFNPDDVGFYNGDGANDEVTKTIVQPDGKILIIGDFYTYNGIATNRIARLNTDGKLDSTFNVGTGIGTLSSNHIYTIALQTNGKILIGGWFSSFNGIARSNIARLNTDGSLDATFNIGTGTNNSVSNIAIQPDGRIIIQGGFSTYNGTSKSGIARLFPNGVLDGSLVVGTGVNINNVKTISVQIDGKILLGGGFTSYNGVAINRLVRLNSNGAIDTTFSIGTGFNNEIRSSIIQPDNKIIIGGGFTNFNGTNINRLIRLNIDGTIDNSFSVGGGANNIIYTLSLQSDGKIIIAGWMQLYNGVPMNYLARLNADGTLDNLFNIGTGTNKYINTSVIQTDGKILFGGNFTSFNDVTQNYLTRLNTDGSLDTSFNVGTGINNTIYAAALQSDGKILIGGSFKKCNNINQNHISRLKTDGSVDFFNIGKGLNDTVRTINIQSDGKILIGGSFTTYNDTTSRRLVRVNIEGDRDRTFVADANNTIYSVAVQSNGKIIIGGSFTTYAGLSKNRIVRLNQDGSIDTTFNIGSGVNNLVRAIAIQTDGKIIIGGNFTTYNGTVKNRIVRLNLDGTIDNSFNAIANNEVLTIVIQPDGKILVGGKFTSFNGVPINYLTRINNDGSMDSSFIGTGGNNILNSITLQSNGKIIIGGDFTMFNSVSKNRILRLNEDGSIDNTFNIGLGADKIVYATVIQPDLKIIIAGNFGSYRGIGRNRIARILQCSEVVRVDTISACNSYTWIDGNTYNQTTNTPMLHFFDEAGCDSITALNFNILSTESIDFVSACNSYTWIDGNTYTSSTNSPIYTEINSVFCDSVITLNLTINSIDKSVTQIGDTLTVVEIGATYQWLDCNNGNALISGEINQNFIPTSNGNYAVAISKNGCIDTSQCHNFFLTSIHLINNKNLINIFPNPTGNTLNIVLNEKEHYQLTIVTIDGKLLESKTMVGNTSLDVSKYSSGMYFITATNNEGKVYQSKFVKE